MNIRAARLYVSPRTRPLTPDEQETRRIAYAIKSAFTTDGIEAARSVAARELAGLMTGPCNLVPVPSRTGDTTANKLLCQRIAAQVSGAKICDVLKRRHAIDGQCERHRKGQGAFKIEEHGIYRRKGKYLEALPTWIVDNVTTSGNTLEACHAALCFGEGLVFADALRYGKWND